MLKRRMLSISWTATFTLFSPDTESEDPRGTRWELHPVTSITVLEAHKKN